LNAWPKSRPERRGPRLVDAVLIAALAAGSAGRACTADTTGNGVPQVKAAPDSAIVSSPDADPILEAARNDFRIHSGAADTTQPAAGPVQTDGAASTGRVAKKDTIGTKSPKGAMLRSALLPGWGQWYNGSKWKCGLVIAGAAGLGVNIAVQNRRASESATDAEREYYVNNRNLAIWWLAGLYALTLVDAYVDAQLWHFDTGPEPGWGNPGGGAAGVRLSVSF
jgi:hypothetical protein